LQFVLNKSCLLISVNFAKMLLFPVEHTLILIFFRVGAILAYFSETKIKQKFLLWENFHFKHSSNCIFDIINVLYCFFVLIESIHVIEQKMCTCENCFFIIFKG